MSLSGEIQIRPAHPAEETRAAELIYGAPSAETVGLAGGAERAAALGAGLFRAGLGRSASDDLLLALRGPRAVGALLGRPAGAGLPMSAAGALRALLLILRLYRPSELPALIRRTRLRGRLDFPVPAGCYYLAELHVEPDARGAGIGSRLLGRADALARERGCERIRLTTSLANPALRLYARHGYVELDRRTVPGYEAITGTPGRALLERRL